MNQQKIIKKKYLKLLLSITIFTFFGFSSFSILENLINLNTRNTNYSTNSLNSKTFLTNHISNNFFHKNSINSKLEDLLISDPNFYQKQLNNISGTGKEGFNYILQRQIPFYNKEKLKLWKHYLFLKNFNWLYANLYSSWGFIIFQDGGETTSLVIVKNARANCTIPLIIKYTGTFDNHNMKISKIDIAEVVTSVYMSWISSSDIVKDVFDTIKNKIGFVNNFKFHNLDQNVIGNFNVNLGSFSKNGSRRYSVNQVTDLNVTYNWTNNGVNGWNINSLDISYGKLKNDKLKSLNGYSEYEWNWQDTLTVVFVIITIISMVLPFVGPTILSSVSITGSAALAAGEGGVAGAEGAATSGALGASSMLSSVTTAGQIFLNAMKNIGGYFYTGLTFFSQSKDIANIIFGVEAMSMRSILSAGANFTVGIVSGVVMPIFSEIQKFTIFNNYTAMEQSLFVSQVVNTVLISAFSLKLLWNIKNILTNIVVSASGDDYFFAFTKILKGLKNNTIKSISISNFTSLVVSSISKIVTTNLFFLPSVIELFKNLDLIKENRFSLATSSLTASYYFLEIFVNILNLPIQFFNSFISTNINLFSQSTVVLDNPEIFRKNENNTVSDYFNINNDIDDYDLSGSRLSLNLFSSSEIIYENIPSDAFEASNAVAINEIIRKDITNSELMPLISNENEQKTINNDYSYNDTNLEWDYNFISTFDSSIVWEENISKMIKNFENNFSSFDKIEKLYKNINDNPIDKQENNSISWYEQNFENYNQINRIKTFSKLSYSENERVQLNFENSNTLNFDNEPIKNIVDSKKLDNQGLKEHSFDKIDAIDDATKINNFFADSPNNIETLKLNNQNIQPWSSKKIDEAFEKAKLHFGYKNSPNYSNSTVDEIIRAEAIKTKFNSIIADKNNITIKDPELNNRHTVNSKVLFDSNGKLIKTLNFPEIKDIMSTDLKWTSLTIDYLDFSKISDKEQINPALSVFFFGEKNKILGIEVIQTDEIKNSFKYIIRGHMAILEGNQEIENLLKKTQLYHKLPNAKYTFFVENKDWEKLFILNDTKEEYKYLNFIFRKWNLNTFLNKAFDEKIKINNINSIFDIEKIELKRYIDIIESANKNYKTKLLYDPNYEKQLSVINYELLKINNQEYLFKINITKNDIFLNSVVVKEKWFQLRNFKKFFITPDIDKHISTKWNIKLWKNYYDYKNDDNLLNMPSTSKEHNHISTLITKNIKNNFATFLSNSKIQQNNLSFDILKLKNLLKKDIRLFKGAFQKINNSYIFNENLFFENLINNKPENIQKYLNILKNTEITDFEKIILPTLKLSGKQLNTLKTYFELNNGRLFSGFINKFQDIDKVHVKLWESDCTIKQNIIENNTEWLNNILNKASKLDGIFHPKMFNKKSSTIEMDLMFDKKYMIKFGINNGLIKIKNNEISFLSGDNNFVNYIYINYGEYPAKCLKFYFKKLNELIYINNNDLKEIINEYFPPILRIVLTATKNSPQSNLVLLDKSQNQQINLKQMIFDQDEFFKLVFDKENNFNSKSTYKILGIENYSKQIYSEFKIKILENLSLKKVISDLKETEPLKFSQLNTWYLLNKEYNNLVLNTKSYTNTNKEFILLKYIDSMNGELKEIPLASDQFDEIIKKTLEISVRDLWIINNPVAIHDYFMYTTTDILGKSTSLLKITNSPYKYSFTFGYLDNKSISKWINSFNHVFEKNNYKDFVNILSIIKSLASIAKFYENHHAGLLKNQIIPSKITLDKALNLIDLNINTISVSPFNESENNIILELLLEKYPGQIPVQFGLKIPNHFESKNFIQKSVLVDKLYSLNPELLKNPNSTIINGNALIEHRHFTVNEIKIINDFIQFHNNKLFKSPTAIWDIKTISTQISDDVVLSIKKEYSNNLDEFFRYLFLNEKNIKYGLITNNESNLISFAFKHKLIPYINANDVVYDINLSYEQWQKLYIFFNKINFGGVIKLFIKLRTVLSKPRNLFEIMPGALFVDYKDPIFNTITEINNKNIYLYKDLWAYFFNRKNNPNQFPTLLNFFNTHNNFFGFNNKILKFLAPNVVLNNGAKADLYHITWKNSENFQNNKNTFELLDNNPMLKNFLTLEIINQNNKVKDSIDLSNSFMFNKLKEIIKCSNSAEIQNILLRFEHKNIKYIIKLLSILETKNKTSTTNTLLLTKFEKKILSIILYIDCYESEIKNTTKSIVNSLVLSKNWRLFEFIEENIPFDEILILNKVIRSLNKYSFFLEKIKETLSLDSVDLIQNELSNILPLIKKDLQYHKTTELEYLFNGFNQFIKLTIESPRSYEIYENKYLTQQISDQSELNDLEKVNESNLTNSTNEYLEKLEWSSKPSLKIIKLESDLEKIFLTKKVFYVDNSITEKAIKRIILSETKNILENKFINSSASSASTSNMNNSTVKNDKLLGRYNFSNLGEYYNYLQKISNSFKIEILENIIENDNDKNVNDYIFVVNGEASSMEKYFLKYNFPFLRNRNEFKLFLDGIFHNNLNTLLQFIKITENNLGKSLTENEIIQKIGNQSLLKENLLVDLPRIKQINSEIEIFKNVSTNLSYNLINNKISFKKWLNQEELFPINLNKIINLVTNSENPFKAILKNNDVGKSDYKNIYHWINFSNTKNPKYITKQFSDLINLNNGIYWPNIDSEEILSKNIFVYIPDKIFKNIFITTKHEIFNSFVNYISKINDKTINTWSKELISATATGMSVTDVETIIKERLINLFKGNIIFNNSSYKNDILNYSNFTINDEKYNKLLLEYFDNEANKLEWHSLNNLKLFESRASLIDKKDYSIFVLASFRTSVNNIIIPFNINKFINYINNRINEYFPKTTLLSNKNNVSNLDLSVEFIKDITEEGENSLINTLSQVIRKTKSNQLDAFKLNQSFINFTINSKLLEYLRSFKYDIYSIITKSLSELNGKSCSDIIDLNEKNN